MKKLILLGLLGLCVLSINAQDSLKLNLGASLTSRYILNGTDVGGNTPAVQPQMVLSKKGLSFGFWGSFAVNNANANEMDWFVKYGTENFSVQFMDVFFPNDTLSSNRYFNYDHNNGTRHNLNVSLNLFGTDKIPIGFHVDTYIYGAMDKANNKNRFSTYMELNYKLKHNDIAILPFFGLTPAAGSGVISLVW